MDIRRVLRWLRGSRFQATGRGDRGRKAVGGRLEGARGDGRYELGGRAFVQVGESTVEHDYHFMALLHEAGLDNLELGPGERGEEFAERLLRQVLVSGQVLPILGCLIVPEPEPGTQGRPPGETWTPELAQETAGFLGSLTSEEDKAKVRTLVLSALIDFFEVGLVSLRTSATSSPREGSPVPQFPAATAPGVS